MKLRQNRAQKPGAVGAVGDRLRANRATPRSPILATIIAQIGAVGAVFPTWRSSLIVNRGTELYAHEAFNRETLPTAHESAVPNEP